MAEERKENSRRNFLRSTLVAISTATLGNGVRPLLGEETLSKAAQAPTLSDRIREELSQSRSRSPHSSGKNTLDSHLRIQDRGVTCQELELYFDRFEYLLGVCGKAGNLNGTIEQGGNPFEAPRSREYPNPPMKEQHAGAYVDVGLFSEASISRIP